MRDWLAFSCLFCSNCPGSLLDLCCFPARFILLRARFNLAPCSIHPGVVRPMQSIAADALYCRNPSFLIFSRILHTLTELAQSPRSNRVLMTCSRPVRISCHPETHVVRAVLDVCGSSSSGGASPVCLSSDEQVEKPRHGAAVYVHRPCSCPS
ncbi:hypothetical protein BD626DRAFT_491341 [Schizophyllum amplum]|uniref:Uncharacterized protein n=1 Tax=Schizophyllum amplum TaxID=97359 RepID=A0A550CHL0_9AGAR|nr:hypothetical protein BD626DRAFT_491341 [Auriculariopsis ampla]